MFYMLFMLYMQFRSSLTVVSFAYSRVQLSCFAFIREHFSIWELWIVNCSVDIFREHLRCELWIVNCSVAFLPSWAFEVWIVAQGEVLPLCWHLLPPGTHHLLCPPALHSPHSPPSLTFAPHPPLGLPPFALSKNFINLLFCFWYMTHRPISTTVLL